MIRFIRNSAWLLFAVFYSCLAFAEESRGWFQITEPQSKNELWINPGMYSYHFQKDQNLNNSNWGIGAEYRFNAVASVAIGNFKNSDNGHSSYVGIYYQPLAIGMVKLGLVAGGFNGYQSTNNGGWFPAVLPALTIEDERIGLNVFFIPTVGDRVHGAISFQLKVKAFDGG